MKKITYGASPFVYLRYLIKGDMGGLVAQEQKDRNKYKVLVQKHKGE
jgi:hypothetical protein